MTRAGRLYGANVEAAIDAAYTRGFHDGVKWVIPGIRIKLVAIMKDMERAAKRTKPAAPFTRATPEKP